MQQKDFVHHNLSAAAAVCAAAALGYLFLDLLLVKAARAALKAWLAGPGAGSGAPAYELFSWAATLAASLLAVLVPALAAVKLGGLDAAQLKLRRARGKLLGTAMGLFLGGSFLLNGVAALVGQETGSIQHYTLPESPAAGLLAFLALAVLPAAAEEILFRGVIEALLRPHGAWFAIWGQAVLFALLHGKLSAVVYALPAGLFLGYLAEACGSLYPGMLLHFLNNLLAFLLLFLTQHGMDSVANLVYLSEGIVFPCWAAAILLCIVLKKRRLPRLARGVSPLRLVRCLPWVLGAAALALYDVLHL